MRALAAEQPGRLHVVPDAGRPCRERYIAEQMEKRMGKRQADEEATQQAQPTDRSEEDLYDIPRHLMARLPGRLALCSRRPTWRARARPGCLRLRLQQPEQAASRRGAVQGQQIQHHDENAHMTAILEIPLSAETRMRNIEDTEAAKHQLLASPSSSTGRHGLLLSAAWLASLRCRHESCAAAACTCAAWLAACRGHACSGCAII